jgi:hypothetical protein
MRTTIHLEPLNEIDFQKLWQHTCFGFLGLDQVPYNKRLHRTRQLALSPVLGFMTFIIAQFNDKPKVKPR